MITKSHYSVDFDFKKEVENQAKVDFLPCKFPEDKSGINRDIYFDPCVV